MKKTFIIFIGIFFFSCNSDTTTHDFEDDTLETETVDENTEMGAGEEVSPQLDMQDDTTAFDVDTVTTPRRSYQ